jgi:two-component system, OmpR family, sensor histidine kinase RstB
VNRLFTRIYAVVGVVLIGSVVLVAVLLPPPAKVELDRQIHGLSGVWPDEVTQRFQAGENAAVAKALEAEFGVPVAVLPEEAVVGSVGDFARRELGQGEPVVQLHDAGPAIYLPLAGEPFVAVLRPPPPPPPWSGPRGGLLAGVILLALGGGVLMIVRPIEQQLEAIRSAAGLIRSGELDARAEVQRGDASGHLAETFNGMAARVQTIVETRKALLHGVAHELRTPLARLKFALELLEDAEGGDSGKIREIQGDVDELEELVSELMRYSQLEGDGELDRSPTSLNDLVGHVVDEARRLPRDRTIEDDLPPLPMVEVDRRLVQRALTNLVNNAVRYADSTIKVSAQTLDGTLYVHVDDDGPGVPEEERRRIFEPFVRLDAARSRDTGGIGLGLALARKGALAHDGDIVVTDSPLGGARFSWSLPLPVDQEPQGVLARLTGTLRFKTK